MHFLTIIQYVLAFRQEFFRIDGNCRVGIIGVILLVVGAIGLLVLQLVLISKRSQTIGKYLVKSQIVDAESGQPASFGTIILMRIIVASIPG